MMNGDAPNLLLLAAVLAAIVAVIVFVGAAITRRARFRCQFCNRVVASYGELDPAVQREIADYFSGVEKRIPDNSAIFVCMSCRLVYDDFSGQKQSREQDPYYGNKTFCKVCNGILYGCSPAEKTVRCGKCLTEYTWYRSPEHGLLFFRPDGRRPLLKRCIAALDSF